MATPTSSKCYLKAQLGCCCDFQSLMVCDLHIAELLRKRTLLLEGDIEIVFS